MGQDQNHREKSAVHRLGPMLKPISRKMFSPGWNLTVSKHGLITRGLRSL